MFYKKTDMFKKMDCAARFHALDLSSFFVFFWRFLNFKTILGLKTREPFFLGAIFTDTG